MLAFLTALSEALPAVGKFVDAIAHNDKKASTAASVAKDPNAPVAVKEAAVAVASQAIQDKAAAEQAALAATTGAAAPAESSSSGLLLAAGAALLLLSKRRRR